MSNTTTDQLRNALRSVHRSGPPVPAFRAASGPTRELDRAWTLMDHSPGQPMFSGLTTITAGIVH